MEKDQYFKFKSINDSKTLIKLAQNDGDNLTIETFIRNLFRGYKKDKKFLLYKQESLNAVQIFELNWFKIFEGTNEYFEVPNNLNKDEWSSSKNYYQSHIKEIFNQISTKINNSKTNDELYSNLAQWLADYNKSTLSPDTKPNLLSVPMILKKDVSYRNEDDKYKNKVFKWQNWLSVIAILISLLSLVAAITAITLKVN